MKKSNNNFLKQLIEIVEKEVVAVIAVAIVLTFVFSQAQAQNQDITNNTQIYPISDLNMQNLNSADILFDGQPYIDFGSQIKGINSPTEEWGDLNQVANFGDSIFTTNPTQLTIIGINNGIWNLHVTGMGQVFLNGTEYYFGEYQNTKNRQVVISDSILSVRFAANSQIWRINSSNPGKYSYLDILEQISTYNQSPADINLIPNRYSLRIGQTFSPVAFIQDQIGKSINNISVSWKSNNSNIAAVNQDGKITAISSGNTIVEATVSGTNLKSNISVTVL